jgi:hypothetical protein
MSSQPSPGERVLISPTAVKDGAFPGEKLVTVNTSRGLISGFVKSDFIVDREGKQYVLAEVRRVSPSELTVRLFGSFFTTTGIAEIPKNTPLLRATG